MSDEIGLSLTPVIIIDTSPEKLDDIPSLLRNVNESAVALSDKLTSVSYTHLTLPTKA